jgi:hypothetical protein
MVTLRRPIAPPHSTNTPSKERGYVLGNGHDRRPGAHRGLGARIAGCQTILQHKVCGGHTAGAVAATQQLLPSAQRGWSGEGWWLGVGELLVSI